MSVDNIEKLKEISIWVLLRITLGWIFLWAFLDKLFGLRYSTDPTKSWADGVSPTEGFLKFGTTGIFGDLFKQLAGNPVVDWMFMLGLLFLGISLLTGIAVRFASVCGIVMMSLMYLAIVPSKNNPLVDEHIIYSLVFFGFLVTDKYKAFSFSRFWSNTALAKRFKFLS